MTKEEIDILWQKAMQESIKDGEMFTRYHFAELVEDKVLAEHAMKETQRLGQEIEPDDIASILACRDMLDAQPVPPRTWVGIGDIENSNAYLTPPQRTEPPQKKVWTFWDLSGGDITDAIKAKIKEKNGGHSAS